MRQTSRQHARPNARTKSHRRRLGRVVIALAAIATLSVMPASAITFGHPDGNGHPAVATLVDSDGLPICTGTLVAPRIVVTAAHCLGGLVDDQIGVSFDSIYRPGVSDVIHGTGIAAVDPARFRGNAGAAGQGGNSDLGDDIAVVHLDRDAPTGIIVAALPTAGLLSSLNLNGQTFTTVGYGIVLTDKTKGPNSFEQNLDPSVRNVAIEEFRSLQSGAITVSQNPATGDGGTCFGDSGGPHFFGDSNLMVAITTLGDSACRSTGRTYRLDIPFARQFLASQGVPVPS